MIDLETAQNSLDLFQTANGSVSCCDTVPAMFLIKIIDIKDGSAKFVKEEIKEEESSPTKRSPRDQRKQRKTSCQETSQVPLKAVPLGKKTSSTAEIMRENKSSEVHVQCHYCTKRSILGTMFCREGKKLGGLTELQETNARITIEEGSRLIQSLEQLRKCRTSQKRTTPWYVRRRQKTSEDQTYWALMRDHFRKSHNKRNP